MGLKAEHIVKILQLRSLGRKTAFKICEVSKDEFIDNDRDLEEIILGYNANKQGYKLPDYSKNDFIDAFKKGNDLVEKSYGANIKILSFFDNDFPKQLKEIQDCPIILNFKGDYKQLNSLHGIAIIGTREPTPEGVLSGEHFGKYFGEEGFNIISGLALGCDSAAHRGCLKGKGYTTAILAHGLHTIYPKENKKLAEDILSNGGVLLSEYIIGTGALPNYFVERDRLQAGLSNATIVIQTGVKGGTMHAVNATLNSGKFLAVVKYKQDITSDKVKGNEMLIREKKAFPLTSENKKDFLNKLSGKSQSFIEESVNLIPKETDLINSIITDKPEVKVNPTDHSTSKVKSGIQKSSKVKSKGRNAIEVKTEIPVHVEVQTEVQIPEEVRTEVQVIEEVKTEVQKYEEVTSQIQVLEEVKTEVQEPELVKTEIPVHELVKTEVQIPELVKTEVQIPELVKTEMPNPPELKTNLQTLYKVKRRKKKNSNDDNYKIDLPL